MGCLMAVASVAANAAFINPCGAEHHLELPQIGVWHAIEIQARERHGRITLHVPCEIAAQDVCDVLLRHWRDSRS